MITGLDHLLSFPRFGNLGAVERMRHALVGLPPVPCLKIVGTNGKGSTATIASYLAQSIGKRVGLYTSPHLIYVNERIQLNGQMISDFDLNAALLWAADRLAPLDGVGRFEVLTLAALYYFSQQDVDLAVLEAGLGGRYDPIKAAWDNVAILTSVDYDHVDILGPTLDHIAREKAAICDAGGLLISGIGSLQGLTPSEVTVIAPPLPPHDVMAGNAILAETALSHLWPDSSFPSIPADFSISGRCELIHQNPDVYVDVAHTPDAVRKTLEKLQNYKLKVIWSVREDKDKGAIAQILTDSPQVIRHMFHKNSELNNKISHIREKSFNSGVNCFLYIGGFDMVRTLYTVYRDIHAPVIRL